MTVIDRIKTIPLEGGIKMMTDKEILEFCKKVEESQKKIEVDADYYFRQQLRATKTADNRAARRHAESETNANNRMKAMAKGFVRIADGIKGHVTTEHESTRKHVTTEATASRKHVTTEANRIIEANTNEHTATRKTVTTEAEAVREEIRRFMGIDIRIWFIIIPIVIIFAIIGAAKIAPAICATGIFTLRNADGTRIIDAERDAAILKLMKWLFAVFMSVCGAFIADAIGSIILHFIDRRK